MSNHTEPIAQRERRTCGGTQTAIVLGMDIVLLVAVGLLAAVVSNQVLLATWDDRLVHVVWMGYCAMGLVLGVSMSRLGRCRILALIAISVFALTLSARMLVVTGNWSHATGMKAARQGNVEEAEIAFEDQRIKERALGFGVAQDLRLTPYGLIQLRLEARRLSALAYAFGLRDEDGRALEMYEKAVLAARCENQPAGAIARLQDQVERYSDVERTECR